MTTGNATIKVYTVEKANQALPLVRNIVNDIQDTYRKIQALQAAGESDELEKTKDELMNLLEELNSLGVEMKGFEDGLIDFYSKRGDKLVYLCWKSGEEKVSYWHDLTTGFTGRKPI
ncbi:MAG: DUF2203 domain-containing protein [Planctomycetes bacterium]|nr:DUF2203 domain-containing protein [Planctomycetota bacterium]